MMVYVTFGLTIGLPIAIGVGTMIRTHIKAERYQRDYWARRRRY